MNVCTDDFGDASCEKVPDDDAAVVAAHGQQGTPAVESAGERHADTVQSAICLLTAHVHKHNEIQPDCRLLPKSKGETPCSMFGFQCINVNFYQLHMYFRGW